MPWVYHRHIWWEYHYYIYIYISTLLVILFTESDQWSKDDILLLISEFENNQHYFYCNDLGQEYVWEAISKNIFQKTAFQCENKWKNLKKSYLMCLRNKKPTRSGQSTFYFAYEEQFDNIYKGSFAIHPINLAGNLIEDDSEYEPKLQKTRIDRLYCLSMFFDRKIKTLKNVIMDYFYVLLNY